ncbi:DUF4403 family protein [Salinimicrobium oceani]|uniref:DUF4403 family protein n=1 Tax=Salinimicrobium oceani TaxID=2722702 RepID=A0ABX1D1Q6_9FLAO|nr:DUF4403 family protein [Salinimicrobium oceani]NJW53594.1 DUF4403 family protein [Salinimicrobium oceani]
MEGGVLENLHKVSIYLPVKIEYKVLETYLQKKFLGKILSKGKANGATSDHAKIQKINLERSPLEDYDLSVYLQLQLLTTLFTNREIKIVMHLSLGFKEAQQEVLITKFRLDGENEGWFTNKVVETFINSFMYAKIKEKMHFDLRPVINKRLEKLNLELSSGKEVVDGISLSGKINEFRVQEIIPGQQTLLVSIKLLGNNVLNIKKIDL